MKRQLLLMLLTLMAGVGLIKADNMNINVDKAANVRVTVNNGETVLDLVDGMNRITEYNSSNSPLTIAPVAGTTIDKVTKNGTEVLKPNYVGEYTLGVEAMMLDIETSGQPAELPSTVQVWFQLNGDKGSVTITCDGEDVPLSSATSQYENIKPGVDCVITPVEGYTISKVEGDRGTVTENSDGTWTYSTTNDMTYVAIETKAEPVVGTDFLVVTPYLPNIAIVAGKNTDDGFVYKDVRVDAEGNAVLPEGYEFINFWPTDDGEILSILRNGEALVRSDWAQWRSYVDEGDIFTVNVQGPEMEVMFYSNDFRNGVGLEAFTVLVNNRPLEGLEGEHTSVTLHRGDDLLVRGKGLNTCSWVMCGNSLFDQAPFAFTLGANTTVSISGKAAQGVRINVNNAAAVVATQLNGYGDVLPLQDGENNFKLEDIQNNLSLTAAEDCQILNVMVNQMEMQPSNDGAYVIKVENGTLIEINARKIPTSVPVTVMVTDSNADGAVSDDLASHVTLTINDEVQTIEGLTTLDVKYLATVQVSVKDFGFVLDSVDAGNNFINVSEGVYTFMAEDPCTLMISMHEVTAPEGSVLVKLVTNRSNNVSFLPYDSDKERIDMPAYDPAQPAVVKIGDYIGVKKFAFDLKFLSITVDGEPIEIGAPDDQEAFQEYFVKIEKECTVEATLFDPNEGRVLVKCWKTDIDPFGLTAAELMINDNGTLTEEYYAWPGEEIELVIPFIAPGYNVTHILGQSAQTPDIMDLNNMKFKVPDQVINPATGDPNFYIFKPAVVIDQANPPIVLEFYPTYVDVPEGKEVVGYLVGVEPVHNQEVVSMFATEGMEVQILSYERDDYRLTRMFDHNDNTVTSPYTVNVADAYTFHGFNKINFGADYELREEGVENISGEGSLRYDPARETIFAEGMVRIVDLNGLVVAEGEDYVNVAGLHEGLYIALSGNKTLKFVRK